LAALIGVPLASLLVVMDVAVSPVEASSSIGLLTRRGLSPVETKTL